jgi:hypothetical protein
MRWIKVSTAFSLVAETSFSQIIDKEQQHIQRTQRTPILRIKFGFESYLFFNLDDYQFFFLKLAWLSFVILFGGSSP